MTNLLTIDERDRRAVTLAGDHPDEETLMSAYATVDAELAAERNTQQLARTRKILGGRSSVTPAEAAAAFRKAGRELDGGGMVTTTAADDEAVARQVETLANAVLEEVEALGLSPKESSDEYVLRYGVRARALGLEDQA